MISLFNTATRRVQRLEPRDGRISLYVCGVTPYDTTHLGHAFTYVVFDVLIRYLRTVGIEVDYAQNVTDIDDDMMRKSRELGISYDRLAACEIEAYERDMEALNVLPPDYFIKASDVVQEIIEAIEGLERAGVTYEAGENLYFRAAGFPNYGSLAGADRERLIELAAEHGGNPRDPFKRDPLDFILWQAEQPGEPAWSSPWGKGRPGWHIECSTIASRFLGTPVDVHGGGRDLIFPHHASEIAQAESFNGSHPFVRIWMHTAMVALGGVKMSKSLGNLVLVRDLLQRVSAAGIRLYLLSHHYRQDFDFDEQQLRSCQLLADRLAMILSSTPSDGESTVVDDLRRHFERDLDTPAVVREVEGIIRSVGKEPPSEEQAAALSWASSVLGLGLERAAA